MRGDVGGHIGRGRPEAQMAAGLLWQDHGLIFASEVDTPIDPDNFSHSFSRLCERAGLGHWRLHEHK